MQPIHRVASALARRLARFRARCSQRRRARPELEFLETRRVLSIYFWTSGDFVHPTLWNDSANWSVAGGGTGVPGAGSEVILDPSDLRFGGSTTIDIGNAEAGAITATGSYTLEAATGSASPQLTLDNNATISTDVGTVLTFASNLTLNAAGSLSATGSGTVIFGGSLSLGQKTFTSGIHPLPNTLEYENTLVTVDKGATIVVGSVNQQTLGGLNGDGTVEMDGGGATLTINTPQGESDVFSGTFVGAGGTIRMSGAGSLTIGDIAPSAGGSFQLDVQSGTMLVSGQADLNQTGGSLLVKSGATFGGPGTVTAGQIAFSDGSAFSAVLNGLSPGQATSLNAKSGATIGANVTLSVSIGPGYQPNVSDHFSILSTPSGTITGQCTDPIVTTNSNGSSTTDNAPFAATYGSNVVTLLPQTSETTTTVVLDPSSPTSPSYRQPVTFDAMVAVSGDGNQIPSGTVAFYDGKPGAGGTQIGTPQTLSGGKATISTAALPVGPDSIYAVYTPDVNGFLGSTTAQPLSLTINKAVLTVIGVTVGTSKPYDGTIFDTLDTTHAALSGVLNGDDVKLVTTGATASYNDKHVATNKPVTVTGLTLSGAAAGNYVVTQPSGFTASITSIPLMVLANGQQMTYGASVPRLTYNAAGLVGGDTASTACAGVLATAATPIAGVGAYTITQGTLTSRDYTIHFNGATLQITPASLTIKANDVSMTSGTQVPSFSVTYSGFVNGDTAASLATPAGVTTTATAASPAGMYPIVVSGATSPNYSIHFVDGTLTVVPAVTVQRVSIVKQAQGKHKAIAVIVVQMTGTPDASAAQDLGNYTLVTMPKGKKKSKRVAIASASWSATAQTVTLVTRKPLVLNPPLRLTIIGAELGLSGGNVGVILSKSGTTIV